MTLNWFILNWERLFLWISINDVRIKTRKSYLFFEIWKIFGIWWLEFTKYGFKSNIFNWRGILDVVTFNKVLVVLSRLIWFDLSHTRLCLISASSILVSFSTIQTNSITKFNHEFADTQGSINLINRKILVVKYFLLPKRTV